MPVLGSQDRCRIESIPSDFPDSSDILSTGREVVNHNSVRAVTPAQKIVEGEIGNRRKKGDLQLAPEIRSSTFRSFT